MVGHKRKNLLKISCSQAKTESFMCDFCTLGNCKDIKRFCPANFLIRGTEQYFSSMWKKITCLDKKMEKRGIGVEKTYICPVKEKSSVV